MAGSPRRVAWDACAWIALIQQERVEIDGKIEDRATMCQMVVEAAKKGKYEIVVSALCLAEVCRDPDRRGNADKLAAYFENAYIATVNVDVFVGERARELMLFGYAGLKPPDAVHLATAAVTPGVEALHTFDKKLLDLDGLIEKTDGTKLQICKPDAVGEPAPLLAGKEANDG